jgi:UDP-3-O-[3-hydroxymyristoyl] glucosamine N-acyltransferase
MRTNDVGHPRFFAQTGPHDIAEVARVAGAELPNRTGLLHGVAGLEHAGAADLAYIGHARHLPALQATRAGAVIVHPDLRGQVPETSIPLVTDNPYLGWALASALFHPPVPVRPGVHPTACVDRDAVVDPSAEIGPMAVVEAGAEVGARCRIGPGAVIGAGVVLGEDCRIGANATLSHAILGVRVYVHPGACIGQEGFGFAIGPTGFQTVPQLGRVLVGDDVEIGANATVDRGSTRDTRIGAGTRLDKGVQIAHNVQIGRNCAFAAHVAISGSVVVGDFVQMGGQVGMSEHLRIGNGVRIGAQAGVIGDLEDKAVVLGSPAMPIKAFFRQVATLKRLAKRGGDASPSPSGLGPQRGPRPG